MQYALLFSDLQLILALMGPHPPSKRTQEVEALIIRTRFETELNMYEIADTLTQGGCPVSARLVGQVLADYGLAKKNG